MKRSELNKNINLIKKQIKELETKKFRYFISNKYIDGFGSIENINNIQNLSAALSKIKSMFSNEREEDENLKELGFDVEVKKEEQTYLGYSLNEWLDEFKMKANEIKNLLKITELKKAKKELSRFLTEDEEFDNAVNKFDSLLSSIIPDEPLDITDVTIDTSEDEVLGF